MTELKAEGMDWIRAATEELRRVSPKEQEAIYTLLVKEHPEAREQLAAVKRQLGLEAEILGRAAEIQKEIETAGKPKEEPQPKPEKPVDDGDEEPKKAAVAKIEVKKGGSFKERSLRILGNESRREAETIAKVVELRTREQRKPEPQVEEPVEVEQGEIIEPGPVDEIARLEAELAEKKALIIPSGRRHLITPGMAAQKPWDALNEINRKHAVITNLGGKCVVMEWAQSQIDPRWEEPSYQTFTSFSERYSNRYVEMIDVVKKVQYTSAEPLAGWWLGQPSRQQYEGLDLVPHAPKVLSGNRLNLWRGYGVQPKEGDWHRLRDHMWVVLANEERRSYDYIRRWIAWKYQNPAGRPEVALNLKGKKGTEKGAIMYPMLLVFGATIRSRPRG